MYFRVQLHVKAEQIDLRIDPGEVEAAVWLPLDDLDSAFNRENGKKKILGSSASTRETLEFDLEEFFPYYPNQVQSGIGKAATFALKFLQLNQHRFFKHKDKDNDKNRQPAAKL